MSAKKIILAIHGLQIKGDDHFEPFLKYAKDKLNYEVVTFNHFDHGEYYSSKYNPVMTNIKRKIKHYQDQGYEVILFGYSAGGVMATAAASNDPLIKSLVLVYPVYKISWYRWMKGLYKQGRERKRLKKKLGKERYNELMDKLAKQTRASVLSGDYTRLVTNVNRNRIKAKKYLSELKDKNVSVFFAKREWVAGSQNPKYIKKNLHQWNNKVSFIEVDSDHMDFQLHAFENEYYQEIVNELNKY